MDSPPAANERCPVTGLPVRRPSAWQNVSTGHDYLTSYHMVGDAILVVASRGRARDLDIERFLAAYDRVVAEAGLHEPWIEIRDMGTISGMVSRQARQRMTEYYRRHADRYRGLVFVRTPIFTRVVVRLNGILARKMRLATAGDLATGLRLAGDMLGAQASPLPAAAITSLSHHLLEFRPEWQYGDVDCRYRNGVLGGAVFFSDLGGCFSLSRFEPIMWRIEAVFASGLFDGHDYVRVVDYSEVDRVPLALRRRYLKAMQDLNQRHGCRPRITYICGASFPTRCAVFFTLNQWRQRLVFVDSVETAFARIAADRDLSLRGEGERRPVLIDAADVDALVQYAGASLWSNDPQDIARLPLDEDHPLRPVAEAMLTLHHDALERDDERTTNAKRLELALAESEARRLEAQRANRELAEQTERAGRAAAEAADANRTKSEFLANMSHEIRTPLNGMMGMVELLLDTGLGREQRHYVKTAMASGSSLLDLINDVLDFSKIEAGALSLERVPFAIRDCIELCLAGFLPAAADRGLELVCAVDPAVPHQHLGDPVRIRQVLSNLLSNAIKFTPVGEVCTRVTDDDGVLVLTVSDTGVGIPEARQAAIFEVFTQADASTTRTFGGTGLGLAIVRQLVEMMDGEITVTSHEGVGSTFTCRLPLPVAIGEEAPVMAPSIAGREAWLLVAHQLRRDHLEQRLRAWGMRVVVHPDVDGLRAALAELPLGQEPAVFLDHAALVEELSLLGPMQAAGITPILLHPIDQRDAVADLEEEDSALGLVVPIIEDLLHDRLAAVLDDASRRRGDGSSGRHHTRLFRAGQDVKGKPPDRVLLVEDNPINRQVALKRLENLGLEVDSAIDGDTAIASLQREDYDLVLMDCLMPGKDGFHCTEEIRSGVHPSIRADIPIIALTASTIEEDRQRSQAVGMNDFLCKPIDQTALLRCLERWLPGRREGPGSGSD